ncbi:MAG TPA: single-stranded-DNA-specific exonuclease RecJ [Thermoanaerobaculia bacterium]|nr:single-stranded-DNA-specific exonuclease RecJ [Thermoanaerobaculia bacterium]
MKTMYAHAHAHDPVWQVRPRDPRASALAARAAIPEVLADLLLARGVSSDADAHAFLSPHPDALHDPHRMKGMEHAADVLVSAARAGRRIVVFGDYDVDGVTSVAQLRAALGRAGTTAIAFLPHRLRDGYGLRPDTVRRVLEEHRPGVIVTVDCGITALEGVACARAAGVEVIVTDHHLVPEELPEGAIVVNPRQSGCSYPEKDLAACGIAMKLALAIARRAGVPLSLESLLRVAALGTIADLVPLLGENRTIAALGLRALAESRAPGLRALLLEAGIAPGVSPTSEEVAFRIAPRLNAAGRLDTAHLALSLFEERDPALARQIAGQLSADNAERQAIERRVTAEARALHARGSDPGRDAVVVLGAAGWHRGVLGIAASRLAREWHRPVLLFAFDGDIARGSGRSVPGVPLHGTLKRIAALFDEFGGHEQAVGASLPVSRFEALQEAARDAFALQARTTPAFRFESADAALDPAEVSRELTSWLARLEPHGMGNPRPVFAASVRTTGTLRAAGESGVKGRLRGKDGAELDFVAWRQPDFPSVPGELIDVHYTLRGGRREVEIVAAKPAAVVELVPA